MDPSFDEVRTYAGGPSEAPPDDGRNYNISDALALAEDGAVMCPDLRFGEDTPAGAFEHTIAAGWQTQPDRPRYPAIHYDTRSDMNIAVVVPRGYSKQL